MPFYCVAANCTNKACLKDGISLHNIPYFNDKRAEAKRRRKVGVDFVCAKRLYVPSKTARSMLGSICSDLYARIYMLGSICSDLYARIYMLGSICSDLYARIYMLGSICSDLYARIYMLGSICSDLYARIYMLGSICSDLYARIYMLGSICSDLYARIYMLGSICPDHCRTEDYETQVFSLLWFDDSICIFGFTCPLKI